MTKHISWVQCAQYGYWEYSRPTCTLCPAQEMSTYLCYTYLYTCMILGSYYPSTSRAVGVVANETRIKHYKPSQATQLHQKNISDNYFSKPTPLYLYHTIVTSTYHFLGIYVSTTSPLSFCISTVSKTCSGRHNACAIGIRWIPFLAPLYGIATLHVDGAGNALFDFSVR